MAPSPAVIAQIEEWIDLPPTSGGRRALVLGPAEPWATLLRARGFEVEVRDELSTPSLPRGSLDLVLAIGALERMPWDRWALQLCHLAMADQGRLILAVPNFHQLTSPSSLAFLAGRLAREMRLRTRRMSGGLPLRERFAGRRYRRSSLLAMVEGLGFHVRVCRTQDAGWLAPLGVVLPRVVARASRSHLVLAERGPSLFGVDPRRPYPDPATHRRTFESAHQRYFQDRTRWLERHPDRVPRSVEPFDPASCFGQNVLVLCPHPDDELIGCGGTLALLIAQGARVTVLHATDGSEAASLWHAPPELARTVRLEEARRVGERMGFDSLIFWNEDNAAFAERPERVRELTDLLGQLRPSVIFTPFVTDIHPDHRVLSRMLAHAIRGAGRSVETSRVLSYQVWSSVPPNLYCDITAVAERQEQALLLYATAMKVDDYVHFCQDRNYHDAVVVAGRPGFVESFLATPADDFPELADTVGGSDA